MPNNNLLRVVKNLWSPLDSQSPLYESGMRWVKVDRRGEPEMYASHPPEQLLAAMCAGLGMDVQQQAVLN